MTPFRFLFVLFLLVPVLEIYLLIQVGGLIGAIPTVFLVVFTAVLGVQLLRFQGLSTLNRVRASLERGEVPATEMLEGAMLLVGGALLLTPGFATDAVGFLCLIPAVRRRLAVWFLGRYVVPPPGDDDHGRHGPRTLEGEFRRENDSDRR